jgi:two-component system, sensor histidine kinase and response regulator
MKKQPSILLVDDLEAIRKVTAGVLHSLGMQSVEQATNGIEAMRLLERQHVDLVISDWNMPGMNGMELLLAMRAHPRLAATPFVMITADAERHRIEEAIAVGVSDFLVKPYTAARLHDSIGRAMTPRRPRPAAVAAIEAPATPTRQAPAPAQATLLLVDDTADNLHLLSGIFNGSYRIRAAHSGQKALAICCSDTPPDLVLLDVMMPEMDGFEVARRMRAHPNAENVPIIFVTALSDDGARLKGMALGAVDFVTKPIEPDLLKLRVDNFMRYVELRRQLQADCDNMLAMARLRDDVEAMTRHDLKGPLAGAVGVLQSLIASDDLDRRQSEQLRMAEEALLQVINMVNLSTELFKIETGRFTLKAESLPIGALLRRLAETARAAHSGKQLVVAVDTDVDVGDDPLCALGDAMLTYSLLSNLIKNACEAAPAGSRVSATLVPGNPLRIDIVNQGTIPEAFRPCFFDKYLTGGKSGGSGLGCYSARLLARAQAGDVDFAVSDTDNTTTLCVTLPSVPSRGH